MPAVPAAERTATRMQLILLTILCLTLFASNSILCRAALVGWDMGPLQYTAVRALSAAAMLAVLCCARREGGAASAREALAGAWRESSWAGAFFLFAYMLCFSLGYVSIPSAAGTLVLNMSVQLAMLGWGLHQGTIPGRGQCAGLAVACAGLVALLMPGLSAPPLGSALLMAGAGIAWGGYSLVGRRSSSAVLATVGNFLRCVPAGIAALLLACLLEHAAQPQALCCAIAAGALASALGYVLWYMIVPRYSLVASSVIQLAVPVITAALAAVFLSEAVTVRLVVCAVLILGGIAAAVVSRR